MELLEKIKKYENLHIVFWLVKDSCWMLEFKMLGIAMVIPTLTISGIIVFAARKSNDVFINLAIFLWIIANSVWMFIEFFNHGEHKALAAVPFAIGFIFVGIFYYNSFSKNSQIIK